MEGILVLHNHPIAMEWQHITERHPRDRGGVECGQNTGFPVFSDSPCSAISPCTLPGPRDAGPTDTRHFYLPEANG
jgi:hypothetical protein